MPKIQKFCHIEALKKPKYLKIQKKRFFAFFTKRLKMTNSRHCEQFFCKKLRGNLYNFKRNPEFLSLAVILSDSEVSTTHEVRFWRGVKISAKTKCKMKRNALTRKKRFA